MRAVGRVVAVLVALAATGCVTHGLNTTYYGANLETALRNGNEFDRPDFVAIEDWPPTLDCMISAVVAEIPLEDQSILVQSMQHGYYEGDLEALYVKYFWQSPINGEIAWPGTPGAAASPDGRLRFTNGNVVPPLDFDIRRHMRKNFEATCPSLAGKYPAILNLPPMEEV